MPNTYDIEQAILEAKVKIDAILQSESKLGNDKSAKAINTCLTELKSKLERRGIKDNDQLTRLLRISFGSFGVNTNSRQTAKTRFEEWYSKQILSTTSGYDRVQWVQLGGFFKDLTNPLSRSSSDDLKDLRGVGHSLQAVVDAEMRHQHELVLAVPFLQRMLDSQNFPQGDKEQLNDFLGKINQLRLRLSKLPMDASTLSAYYQSREYQQCQKLLAELESTYSYRIKPLILKADKMNKGELKGGFHWHLDGSAEDCLTVLDNLHAKHQENINDLIGQLPVEKMTPIHSARQKRQSEYSGQQLVRKLLGDVPAADKKATFFSANNSGLTRKSALATQLLTDFDLDLPMLPESIKEDDDFKRGCLEELLISARPQAFQMNPLTGNFEVLDGRLASLLNINSNELNPKNFTRPVESSDPLCKLLYCLKPVDATFTKQDKIDAYIELIKCVRKGQLNLSTTADHLTQAREIAEKLLYLAVEYGETARLTPVNDLIKSGVLEQGIKKMKQGANYKPGAIEEQQIQRLYREIEKLSQNPALLKSLENRITSLHDYKIVESVASQPDDVLVDLEWYNKPSSFRMESSKKHASNKISKAEPSILDFEWDSTSFPAIDTPNDRSSKKISAAEHVSEQVTNEPETVLDSDKSHEKISLPPIETPQDRHSKKISMTVTAPVSGSIKKQPPRNIFADINAGGETLQLRLKKSKPAQKPVTLLEQLNTQGLKSKLKKISEVSPATTHPASDSKSDHSGGGLLAAAKNNPLLERVRLLQQANKALIDPKKTDDDDDDNDWDDDASPKK